MNDSIGLLTKQTLTKIVQNKLAPCADRCQQRIGHVQLKLFDLNGDGKLQLSEMARLIPVEENFLCRPIFKRGGRITVADVDRVFALYDTDENGAIEDLELSGFLKDLLELVQEDYDESDLEFTRSMILKNWDFNKDGKISLEEMRMLLMAYSIQDSNRNGRRSSNRAGTSRRNSRRKSGEQNNNNVKVTLTQCK